MRHLVASQFPEWSDLPIHPIVPGGWDNRTFRLGEEMVIRMPSGKAYGAQVEKEQKWLPKLAPLLPLPIPEPLALGKPTEEYPWKWSIYRWIEGEPASSAFIANLSDFAKSLAQFLIALQKIDAAGGPMAGPHNFYRGGALSTYDAETRKAIAALNGKINRDLATEIWEKALETTWRGSPVWVHGDVSATNLLVQEGRLSAVIDFGILGVGDPACDLAIAWTFFEGESRVAFQSELSLDRDTWDRARGWTLWKALIVAAGVTNSIAAEKEQCWRVIKEVFKYKN